MASPSLVDLIYRELVDVGEDGSVRLLRRVLGHWVLEPHGSDSRRQFRRRGYPKVRFGVSSGCSCEFERTGSYSRSSSFYFWWVPGCRCGL
jgi:hypothetical protein